MTIEEFLFSKYRDGSILLDANLLLLYLVGSFQRERIVQFKRTSSFSVEEFDILVRLLLFFSRIVTTPHLLTEVNNLANSLPEYLNPTWSEHFAAEITRFFEVREPATSLVQVSSFSRYGLTDAAVHQAARDTLVLTDDFRLSGFLRSEGIAVLNFRDLAFYL